MSNYVWSSRFEAFENITMKSGFNVLTKSKNCFGKYISILSNNVNESEWRDQSTSFSRKLGIDD